MNASIAVRIWFTTWLMLLTGFVLTALFTSPEMIGFAILAGGVAFIGSLPSLVLLIGLTQLTDNTRLSPQAKIAALFINTLIICAAYGTVASYMDGGSDNFYFGTICAAVLYACSLIAIAIHYKAIRILYYNEPSDYNIDFTYKEQLQNEEQSTPELIPSPNNISSLKTTIHMQQDQQGAEYIPAPTSSSNKVLIKAAITGALILVMLIPTLFISNLVREREQRQKEVVAEVSNKWAKAQTITGPYIVVPYTETGTDSDRKSYVVKKPVILLPEDLQVSGSLTPEERKRSIYTVLLYKTNIDAVGKFVIKLPAEIDAANLSFNEAKLCVGINDFKGIEEKVSVNFNGVPYDLTPGLPTNQVDETGLSCNVPLSPGDFGTPLTFNLNLKIKGSEQLAFVPLSGNSTFALKSPWPNPSFDGASLPSDRKVTADGFEAKWSFNKANLPFNTVLKDFKMDKAAYGFGVSMVQPADQYAKTMRSVKYAILFIGLTFSLFFIVEVMQKRPVHPVQYVLVGLALVIFYTLLLSISEFVLFDNAYLIAATATVSLITLYAKGHFASWKIAGVFALVLGMLYGFIFVLIRLEDTALLVGSIGLFAVLALVMYASRRINWYQPSFNKASVTTA